MHIRVMELGVSYYAFCCDSCHQQYCRDNNLPYEGWNGCHEAGEVTEFCANCGTVAGLGENACECQRRNVVVNRFLSENGERCEHGNWIQLPSIALEEDFV